MNTDGRPKLQSRTSNPSSRGSRVLDRVFIGRGFFVSILRWPRRLMESSWTYHLELFLVPQVYGLRSKLAIWLVLASWFYWETSNRNTESAKSAITKEQQRLSDWCEPTQWRWAIHNWWIAEHLLTVKKQLQQTVVWTSVCWIVFQTSGVPVLVRMIAHHLLRRKTQQSWERKQTRIPSTQPPPPHTVAVRLSKVQEGTMTQHMQSFKRILKDNCRIHPRYSKDIRLKKGSDRCNIGIHLNSAPTLASWCRTRWTVILIQVLVQSLIHF